MSFKYTPNTLKKLEQLYEEARYIIRYEKGNFNSGYCILEDRRVVVINKFLQIEGRINALVEILPAIQVNEAELSGEMLKWYQQMKEQPGYASAKERSAESESEVPGAESETQSEEPGAEGDAAQEEKGEGGAV